MIGEFVFANTWSMMLVIGNPTNIYLAESFDINFFEYFKVMLFPTMITGVFAYLILILMFHKELSKKINEYEIEHSVLRNKTLSIFGLEHLTLCTILLAISSYIGLEMWIITAIFAISMVVVLLIYYMVRKEKIIKTSLKRVPWNLIPFILSMFVMVGTLTRVGIINTITNFLNQYATSSNSTIVIYGMTSFVSCNILNNISMSVMFERIINFSNTIYIKESIYATIIASNIGAYLTPVGALAGIMWMGILNKMELNFGFREFIKKGIVLSPIMLFVALVTLSFIL